MKFNLSDKIILIVEDYPVMRKSIKEMLYTLGAQYIFETENGAAAISAMKKQKFDIVLCDYDLGEGRNGQQILEEARLHRLIQYKTLFIIVTAYQTTTSVLSAIENRPDDYLTKPFNAQQLYSRIEKSYRRKQAIAEIHQLIEHGYLFRAISQCEELLAQKNKTLETQLLKIRTELAIQVGDFSTAENIFEDVLKKRELPWAQIGMGIVAYYRDEFPKAIQIFTDLLRQNPLLMECYDWLATLYEQTGQLDAAERILNQATEISPHSFTKQKRLAVIADKNGNLTTAEKAYETVTTIGRYSVYKSPSDFSGLARVYSKQNKDQHALKAIESMKMQFVNNTEAELRSAGLEMEVYKKMGETKLAQQAFEKLNDLKHQISTTSKDLQLDIAKACYIYGDEQSANDIIGDLVRNHVDNDSFMTDIKRMQSEIGRVDQTDNLIAQTRQELLSINNKGVELFKTGKINEAYQLFEQAFKKMPHNRTILLNITKLLLHQLRAHGISDKLVTQVEKYLKLAAQAGVPAEKLGYLQMEFEKITHLPKAISS